MSEEEKQVQGPAEGRFKTSKGVVEFTGPTEAIYELLELLSENNVLAAAVKRIAKSTHKATIELGPADVVG